MFMKSLIICVIISLTYAIKNPFDTDKSNQLVGGRDPKYGELKYLVVVHSGKIFCGGAIIDEKFILTAAHCIEVNEATKKLLQPMRIVAGTNVAVGYNRAQVIQVDVKKVYLTKPYTKGSSEDIALLELKNPLQLIKYHNKIQKLSLPQSLSKNFPLYPNYENVPVKFAGYGNTHAEIIKKDGKTEIKRSGAGRLQVGNAVINDARTCKKYFKGAQSSQMCLSVIEDETKQKAQGTCTGDSGSPAVYNNSVIIGLDSRGIYCNNNMAPSLFTRVSSFIPFIHQAMSGNSSGLVVYNS